MTEPGERRPPAVTEADRRQSHAEDALRRSEERYRALFDAVPVGLYRTASDGRIANANPAMAQMLGFATVEELIGSPAVELYVRPDVRREWTRRLETDGLVQGFEAELRRRDGSALWALESARAALDDEGRILHIEGTVQDITERKRAELRLQESEAQYRLLFDANPYPMWVIDIDTFAFRAANDAAVASYGFSREEFLRMGAGDIRPPEDVAAMQVRIRTGATLGAGVVSIGDLRHRKKDGTVFDVHVTSSTISFAGRPAALAMAVDITESRRAAAALEQMGAQLHQSQKMEAIGQLAGGVAHDFNNLLGVIIGYSDLLLRDAPKASLAARRLAGIREAGDRAAALTRELLAFGRRQVLQPRVLDLNALVTEARPMLARVVNENVAIVTVLDPALGRVRADPGQIQQVILNFAVNARDAMPDGGTFTLETRNVTLDDASSRGPLAPGPYAAMLVTDTGHGMAPDVLEHMFEPFFTTRSQRLGAGLGLATVYGVVTQSGGHLEVESAVGRGTTFTVYLPHAVAEAEAPAPLAPAPVARAAETILLVEDAAPLREMVQEILESEGFVVIAAESGEHALAAAAAHEGAIALVISDVVMPGMSGPVAAERLQALRPGTRVLLMSGYADAATGREGGVDARTHFIQKPFSADTLLQKVREVMASPFDQGTGA